MRRWFAAVLFLLFSAVPLSANAETAKSPAPAVVAESASSTIFGLPPGQAVTVGVGIIAGGLVMDMLVGGSIGVLTGAVAGAMIGTWWFDTYGPTLEPLNREPGAAH